MSSTYIPGQQVEPVVAAARERENILAEGEIIRHRRNSRLIHWSVALTFFISLLSGMPIWTPLFAWMAALLGGLDVCRVIHPYAGVAFFLFSGIQFFHWLKDMHLLPTDWEWFGPKVFTYMHRAVPTTDKEKYNGGQKLFFYAVTLGAIGLLVSGIVMWFPLSFGPIVRALSILLHDLTFILFLLAIITHIYLGTAAEPGTFRAMTRGTVTRAWAMLHHPGWYLDSTGEKPPEK